MDQLLLVSVLITARDMATAVFRRLGLESAGAMGVLSVAALAVGGAIAAVAVESTRLAVGFDQAMHKVAALTDVFKDSSLNIQWYQDQLLALAPQIDVAPTKLADALYFVASAGFKGKQAIEIIRYSAMAAAASMGDMKRVADLVTSAMNAYSQQGLSAAHATDVIMQAVRNGKVEMHALETSFAFVATTGLASKFGIEEVAAAVSTLTHVSGNTAARRVQMDLDNLIRRLGDVGGIAKEAKKLHLGFNEAQFASEHFIERLKTLMQMTGFTTDTLDQMWAASHHNQQVFEQMALKAAQNSTAFKSLAGGAAAMIPAVILMNDKGKTFNGILKEMWTNGEYTAQAFKTMRESTGQQWRMFQITLESIGTQLGLHILPALNAILPVLIGLGRNFILWLQQAANLQQLRIALLGIGLVIGGILAVAIAHLIVFLAPFIAAITAIIVGGTLLGRIIQALVAHFGGWDAILRRLHPIIVLVQQAFAEAGKQIQKALADPQIQAAWKQFQAALPGLLPILKALAIVVGVTLFVAFKIVVEAILIVIKAIPLLLNWWAALYTAIGAVARFIQLVFNPSTWANLWNGIVKAAQAFGTALLNTILAPFRLIGQAFVWLYEHNRYVQMLVATVRGLFVLLVSIIRTAITAAVTWLEQQWQKIQLAATVAWNLLVQNILKPIQNALTLVKQTVQKNIIDPITQLLTNLATAALQSGINLITNLGKGIAQGWNTLKTHLGNAAGAIGNFLGFHSPTKEGPGRDADTWAPNLIRMYSLGLLAGIPRLAAAANQAAGAVAGPLGIGGTGRAAGAAGTSLAGLASASIGGDTHHWAGAFPNATNQAEIMAALESVFDRRERMIARKARRAGFGGGLRAGF